MDQELNRRMFVKAAAVTVCGLAVGCQSGSKAGPGGKVADADDDDDLPKELNPTGIVAVGSVADYPKDGVYDKYARDNRIYIVRAGNSIYAMRSICTHKTCLVVPKNSGFACPCHGSRFDINGNVLKGPAADPLPHYGISKSADGALMVDKSKRLGPKDSDPAMSVPVA